MKKFAILTLSHTATALLAATAGAIALRLSYVYCSDEMWEEIKTNVDQSRSEL